MRRSHRKSRYGCKECKQKHKRCDETRPSCTNCVTNGRRCSYLDSVVRLASSLNPIVTLPSPASSITTCVSPKYVPNALIPHGGFGERYSLLHLELLRDYDDLGMMLGCLEPRVQLTLQHAVKEAMTTPYLMDELLACSAAYKSTLPGDRQAVYRTESTRLQTRAISEFNAVQPELMGQNYMAIFAFSSFLGHHSLFDTFSCRGGITEVLDRFVQCLRLHHGVRTIAGNSWSKIHQMHPHLLPKQDAPRIPLSGEQEDECGRLKELIRGSSLANSSKEECVADVDLLQSMFESQRCAIEKQGSRRFLVVQEWLVRVSVDFTDLVNQRRPEALVILAYYAVLLHRAKAYWVVGDSGSYLIRTITTHLGPYWAEWLRWPNKILDAEQHMDCRPTKPKVV
jgi:hypothetical protein